MNSRMPSQWAPPDQQWGAPPQQWGAPPQQWATPPYQPTPPPKKRRHVVRWIVLAFIGIVVIAGIASASSNANKTSPKNNGGVITNSDNGSHPPQQDVAVSGCSIDELGFPTATGTIVNHSSKTSDYELSVNFLKGGVHVSDGADFVNNVAPGQTATWNAGGTDQVSGQITCQMAEVNRIASGG